MRNNIDRTRLTFGKTSSAFPTSTIKLFVLVTPFDARLLFLFIEPSVPSMFMPIRDAVQKQARLSVPAILLPLTPDMLVRLSFTELESYRPLELTGHCLFRISSSVDRHRGVRLYGAGSPLESLLSDWLPPTVRCIDANRQKLGASRKAS